MIARFRAIIDRFKALWERLQPTLPVRAWTRYGDLRGDRLAGAASFYGFVSLFPLLLIAAAIASRVAGADGVETVQELVDDNLPGLGIEVSEFQNRAGAIGVLSAVILLYSGLRWVDSVRAAVRWMWGMDDQPGNFVVRKLLDMVALLGLGLLLAISWGTSVFVREMTQQLLEWLGLEGTGATTFLQAVSWLLSVGVNTLLFAYLLAGLPRILVPAKEQALTALLGAVLFEILKTFLVEYVVGPAGDNRYAAFATPLAVIAWIYIVTRLLMVLAALTAESAIDHLEDEKWAGASSTMARHAHPGLEPVQQAAAEGKAPAAAATTTAAATSSSGGGRAARPGAVTVSVSPSARQARTVGVVAGSVLGAAGVGLAFLTGRAVRTLRSLNGRDERR